MPYVCGHTDRMPSPLELGDHAFGPSCYRRGRVSCACDVVGEERGPFVEVTGTQVF